MFQFDNGYFVPTGKSIKSPMEFQSMYNVLCYMPLKAHSQSRYHLFIHMICLFVMWLNTSINIVVVVFSHVETAISLYSVSLISIFTHTFYNVMPIKIRLVSLLIYHGAILGYKLYQVLVLLFLQIDLMSNSIMCTLILHALRFLQIKVLLATIYH